MLQPKVPQIVEVQVSGKAMSETEVFTATATGIYGVRVGEDHVSGTEDGKLGNTVLVELTNTLAVPLDLAKRQCAPKAKFSPE